MKQSLLSLNLHRLPLQWTVIAVLLLGGSLPLNGLAEPNAVQNDIDRLRKLSESRHEQALSELEQRIAKLPADAAFSTRRDMLDVLAPLYLRNKDRQKIKDLIAQLNQIGKNFNDLQSTALALNYQAKLFELDNNYTDSLELIEQGLALTAGSQDSLLINKLEYTAAELYSSIGNFQVAIKHQQRALSTIESVKKQTWQTDIVRAKTLFLEAYLYYSINDQPAALNYLGQALEIAQRLDAPVLEGQILNSRGTSYAYLKQWNLARTQYIESQKIAQKSGNATTEALSLTNLADVSMHLADFKACAHYSQQAIAIAQKYNDAYTVALAQGNSGICSIYSGDVDKGRQDVERSLVFLKQANELSIQEITLEELSVAYAKTGMYREAWHTVQEKSQVSTKMAQERRDNSAYEVKVLLDLFQRQKDREQIDFKNALQIAENEAGQLKLKTVVLMTALSVLTCLYFLQLYRRLRVRRNRQDVFRRTQEFQTSRDPLTGLLNRRAFQAVIELRSQLMEHRSTENFMQYDVVVLLKVDRFKDIVNQFGHDLGNEVLVELSKRLQNILREKDMLIRWSSEEFLIYLNAVPADRVIRIVERELEEIGRTAVLHAGQKIQVTVSAGYVLLPLNEAKNIRWEKVIELIEDVLVIAQSNGGNQACGIEGAQGSTEKLITLLTGTDDLTHAMENGIVEIRQIDGPKAGAKV